MGGKSRKTGSVSKKLIEKIKNTKVKKVTDESNIDKGLNLDKK